MSSISPELKRFILTSIPSVPHLEAVLLMHGQPGERRTAIEVGARLYVPEHVAAGLLQSMCDAGLLSCEEGSYWYEPGNPSLDGLLDALSKAYAADLVGVTKLIHDATQRTARRFADAFKLRKDK
jgi:hypothetical protein